MKSDKESSWILEGDKLIFNVLIIAFIIPENILTVSQHSKLELKSTSLKCFFSNHMSTEEILEDCIF